MKFALAVALNLFLLLPIFAQHTVVTTDIDNFWTAYDKIVTTKDNAEQLDYLNKLFIEKGTPGLVAMMKARNYKPQEYVDAINKRPEYWTSIRKNTLRAGEFAKDIEAGAEKLKALYPDLKPANVYFTVGVFRSGGTTSGSNILIGSEIVFADEKIMGNLEFTNVHEYVHTQQKSNEQENLIAQSVMEGVAEFVTVKALGVPSFAPAIAYGHANEAHVKEVFARQMFNTYTSFWLYSDAKNEFNTRDLGYYVGYAIAEGYYEKAADKKRAIKDMIEVDYADQAALAKYVDMSGYFGKSVESLHADYETSRPRIVNIKEIKNGDQKVDPSINHLTFEFSQPMNSQYRNFQYGALGVDNSIRIKKFEGFSEDGKSFSVEIDPLQPNKRYQLIVGSGFRDNAGVAMKPYAIDIMTGS